MQQVRRTFPVVFRTFFDHSKRVVFSRADDVALEAGNQRVGSLQKQLYNLQMDPWV